MTERHPINRWINQCQGCGERFMVTPELANAHLADEREAYPNEDVSLEDAVNTLSRCPDCSGFYDEDPAGVYRCWFQDEDLQEFKAFSRNPDFDALRLPNWSYLFLYAEELDGDGEVCPVCGGGIEYEKCTCQKRHREEQSHPEAMPYECELAELEARQEVV